MNLKQNTLISIVATICLAICACSPNGTITETDNSSYTIFPDYKNVTIPCNIAPLNFSLVDAPELEYALLIEGNGQSIWVNANGKDFAIAPSKWKKLLKSETEHTLTFTIARKQDSKWIGGSPFVINVVPDQIDDYITYRLIPPGYESWTNMGIYQHQLSTSKQTTIFENTHTGLNCVNCHTAGNQSPQRTLLHMRAQNGGTYINRNGNIERIDAKTDSTISAFVYPAWHPNGQFIAFSNNLTAQTFHTSHPNLVEVFDDGSDVIVYDADYHEIFTSPLLKQPNVYETFPTFSPDGNWLYFCSAPAVDQIELNFANVHYSLCRIAFDAETRSFGNSVDTLYNAQKMGGSVSFPRISPDGRMLVFTLSQFGNFSIWHHDADLYAIDFTKRTLRRIDEINSPDVESYHSWSSNSRWLVFSSRRNDGQFTRPYFAYFDANGQAHKPFMLPQQNPAKHYMQLDFSYNIPEFMTGPAIVKTRQLYKAAQSEMIEAKYIY